VARGFPGSPTMKKPELRLVRLCCRFVLEQLVYLPSQAIEGVLVTGRSHLPVFRRAF